MKPKEYINRFKTEEADYTQESFIIDLAQDFVSTLKKYKSPSKPLKRTGFEMGVRVIRARFESVVKQVFKKDRENLWKYFYATVIIPVRERLLLRGENK